MYCAILALDDLSRYEAQGRSVLGVQFIAIELFGIGDCNGRHLKFLHVAVYCVELRCRQLESLENNLAVVYLVPSVKNKIFGSFNKGFRGNLEHDFLSWHLKIELFLLEVGELLDHWARSSLAFFPGGLPALGGA